MALLLSLFLPIAPFSFQSSPPPEEGLSQGNKTLPIPPLLAGREWMRKNRSSTRKSNESILIPSSFRQKVWQSIPHTHTHTVSIVLGKTSQPLKTRMSRGEKAEG